MPASARVVTFQQLIDAGVLEIGDGYRAQNSELGGTGPIFLRAGHVTDTHIDFTGVERFHDYLADKVRPKMSRSGDTIVTTKGNSTGRTSYATDALPPFVYSPHLSYWRTRDPEQLCQGFLRYWSQGDEFVRQLSAMKTSTDMAPYLSLTDQRRLRITLPNPQDQRRAVSLLSSLDDKIDSNRRMNATLEAMSRALFQSWFVDFDPVRAKLDRRRPTGLDDATANLFPSSFQDSRLGPIPDQWEIHSVGELLELAYGKPLKAENRRPGPIGVYGSNGRVGWHDASLVTGPGIVVGRKGNPGVVTWAHDDFYPIDTTFYVVPTGACRSLYFLYYTLGALDLSRFGADSAVPGLNRNHAYMSHLVLPPSQVCAAFDSLAAPLFAKVNSNERESITLAILRDALLPRLLSGELSVAGVEAQL